MSDKELIFNQGSYMLGVRGVEPCTCGKDDCKAKNAIGEITILVSPAASPALCKSYLEHAEGAPMAFPVFMDTMMARKIAAQLTQLANEADANAPIDTKQN